MLPPRSLASDYGKGSENLCDNITVVNVYIGDFADFGKTVVECVAVDVQLFADFQLLAGIFQIAHQCFNKIGVIFLVKMNQLD